MSTEPYFALPVGYRLRRYVLGRVLSHQSFSILYLAHDHELCLDVVIKELLPQDLVVRARDGSTVIPKSPRHEAQFAWARARFLEEGQALSRLRHASILTVREGFEENGTAYLVTPFVQGETLEVWLARRSSPGEAELCAILRPLLTALQLVHECGFLHRDIKPVNIFMDLRSGVPALTGFANVRRLSELQTSDLCAILTPHYAPFEQYQTCGKLGPWTDLYSLGAVLYRAVTGKVPPSAVDRLHQDTRAQLDGLSRREGYSPAFLAMIDKALRMRREERWQTCAEWLAALDRLVPACPQPSSRLRRAVSAVLGFVRSPRTPL